MVARIAKAAGIPRHISSHSLRQAAITNALDAGVPLRDAQILARHAEPRSTEHYDRARGNHDRHDVHLLTAYVAGVSTASATTKPASAYAAVWRAGVPSGVSRTSSTKGIPRSPLLGTPCVMPGRRCGPSGGWRTRG